MTRMTTTAPREIQVTRYVCPHCSRGHSKRDAATAHIARCWSNPALRGCKTCEHFIPGDRLTTGPVDDDYDPEHCARGLLDNATRLATGCPGWEQDTPKA